jgi:hypothetical protein
MSNTRPRASLKIVRSAGVDSSSPACRLIQVSSGVDASVPSASAHAPLLRPDSATLPHTPAAKIEYKNQWRGLDPPAVRC